MALITLPHDWTARDYQAEAFQALDSGIRSAMTVWHRRAGKDNAALHYLVKAAHKRIGNYWHLLPSQRQARRAIWEGIDNDGKRILTRAAPGAIIDTMRNDEMFVKFKNGSTLQVTGADQFDSLVGSNPVGVIMSEYALTSPLTLKYLSPILALNGGWLWVNTTPRGHNHAYRLWNAAVADKANWFTSLKTILDTKLLTPEKVQAEITAGMLTSDEAQQEYYCSWNAPNVGVVYGKQLEAMKKNGAVGDYPHDPRLPCETYWDIGHRDATAIWIVQRVGRVLHFIDYIEDRGKGLPYYAGELHKKPYSYNRHVGPHDLEQKIWALDAKTLEVAKNFGIFFTVAPKTSISEGIAAARLFLPRCRFNATTTLIGLAALENYHYEWDEDTRLFTDKPVHDWSSHGSDAFRYGAVTPEWAGVTPDWFSQIIVPSGMSGHNGGPPMAEYDPLADFRRAHR